MIAAHSGRNFVETTVLCFIIALAFGGAANAEEFMNVRNAQQLVLVTTSGWRTVGGELRRYERSSIAQPWNPVGDPIPVVVGRNGMAWARTFANGQAVSRSFKKEGDGKAPAGIFKLGPAFGYATDEQAGDLHLPYIPSSDLTRCIDDSSSRYYNQIINRQDVKVDWNSDEEMKRNDELYRWGVVVQHNQDPTTPRDGSCIFLHIWKNADTGTAGCTAMPAEKMEELMRWLNPRLSPVLAQFPQAEYSSLKEQLGLP